MDEQLLKAAERLAESVLDHKPFSNDRMADKAKLLAEDFLILAREYRKLSLLLSSPS